MEQIQARFLDILHLVAWNGYTKELNICTTLCKEAWLDNNLLEGLRNETGWFETTRVHRAIAKDDFDMVLRLARVGANMNAKDRSGQSPLGLAIKRRFPCMVQLLIQLGADVNEVGLFGDALRYAEYEEWRETSFEILYMLLDHPNIDLGMAANACASMGDLDRLKDLLENKGVDPRADDERGFTILANAVVYLRLEIIQYLLENYDLDVEEDVCSYDITGGYMTKIIELICNDQTRTEQWREVMLCLANKSKNPRLWKNYIYDDFY
jgi:ankyrin repeat protein